MKKGKEGKGRGGKAMIPIRYVTGSGKPFAACPGLKIF